MRLRKRILSWVVVLALAVSVIAIDTEKADAASSRTYWIKVNKQANVATVYKRSGSKWKPIRAMLVTTGTNAWYAKEKMWCITPSGNFRIGIKMRWGEMMEEVYAQYCSQVRGNILFHSVFYNRKNSPSSQASGQFYRLGSKGSHGCIRLCVMDAKWIYENCPGGTKVTVYSSRKAGPLGKPKRVGVRVYGWDPTDPNPRNPGFNMRRPVIKISKSKPATVQFGSSYSLKSKVTAKNTNANQSLTSKLKISSVKKWKSGKWKKVKKFTTRSLGKYKITYKVHDKYCGKRGTAKKSFVVNVVDTKAPTIYAYNRTTKPGQSTAVTGVSAKQADGTSRTGAMTVTVTGPQGSRTMSYAVAKAYVLSREGVYTITYSVRNTYKPYKKAVRTIAVRCYGDAVISRLDPLPEPITVDPVSYIIMIPAQEQAVEPETGDYITADKLKEEIGTIIKIRDVNAAGTRSDKMFNSVPDYKNFISLSPVLIEGENYETEDEVTAIITYRGFNGATVSKTINIEIGAFVPDGSEGR